MSVQQYRELIVWQKAMSLVKEIYCLTTKLPKEELYGLSSQVRRAAISIPSNIAEGQARNSTKEFTKFLSIARGSKAELQTQLLICVEIGYLSEADINTAMGLSEEVGKMLSSLIQKLTTDH
ncbi:MAG: four helix bundle protein [Acidobacteriota bacterium]|jgi:four helix bundle protein|nr:four helix bundle protein [Acidobacteriota bacterium]